MALSQGRLVLGRDFLGLGVRRSLQCTNVADDGPAVRHYDLIAVGGHGAAPVGDDVENVAVGELHHAVFRKVRWLPGGHASGDDAVPHAGLIVAGRAVGVEPPLALLQPRHSHGYGTFADVHSVVHAGEERRVLLEAAPG